MPTPNQEVKPPQAEKKEDTTEKRLDAVKRCGDILAPLENEDRIIVLKTLAQVFEP